MPSRATTQIAREIQKPSACWSSASAGGVPSVLIASTSSYSYVPCCVAERQVSGAGNSGSDAGADAVSRRLQTLDTY